MSGRGDSWQSVVRLDVVAQHLMAEACSNSIEGSRMRC